MAQRLLSRTSDRAVYHALWRVGIAVGVVVALGWTGWSCPAIAQQALKIRLVNDEQEPAQGNAWNQKAMAIGSDVLTPPGETSPSSTQAFGATLSSTPVFHQAQTPQNTTPLFAARPNVVEGPPSMLIGSADPASSEMQSPAMLNQPMPGYLPGPDSGILNPQADPTSSTSESETPPYKEPDYESYKQQKFQNRLFGFNKYLLNAKPEDEEDFWNNKCSDGPERVWEFAPLRRVGRLGHRFFGPSPAREAFSKLFPWNRTPGRNQGVGQPLVNDSWQWAPFGAGWFMGYMDGNTLVTNWTGAKGGYFGGYHLNWDFDYYWGTEFRYGVATLAEWDSQRAMNAQAEAGIPYTSQFARRHATLKYGDFSFLYYPWGDARWRPYAKMGIGWGYVKFTDLLYNLRANTQMTMPMGVGVKYRYSRRIVLRMEVMDNFLFGERGINPQHNLSITGGVEIRFGGPRKAYWPYDPGRHYW